MDAFEAVKAALALAGKSIKTTILLAGDDPVITFDSEVGTSYLIEYKDNIDAPSWQVLVADLTATSAETTYRDDSFNNRARRFYRVRRQ